MTDCRGEESGASRVLRRALFALCLLIAFVFVCYWAQPITNLFVSSWDDGNSHYAYVAWSKGQVPNIDFVYGYPGLTIWIQRLIYESYGFDVGAQKALVVIVGFLNALALSGAVLFFFGWLPAAVVFCFGVWVGIIHWPVINPGYFANLFVTAGALAALCGLKQASVRHSAVLPLAIAGFLIGLGLGFKQHAVFAVVGYFLFLTWALDRRKTAKWATALMVLLFAIVPFASFFLLRVFPHLAQRPLESLVMIPWLMVVLLTVRDIYGRQIQRYSISFKELLGCATVSGLGASVWLLIYPEVLTSAPRVLYEIYFRVPKLIDREIDPLPLSGMPFVILSGLIFGGLLLILLCRKYCRTRLCYAIPFLLIFAVWTTAVILKQPSSAIEYFFAFSPTRWELYLVPTLFLSVSCLALLLRGGLTELPISVVFFFLVGASFWTSMYPYYGNFRYVSLALVLCYLAPVLLVPLSAPSRWVRISGSALLVLIILALTAESARRIEDLSSMPLRFYPKLQQAFRAPERTEVLIQVADYLRPRVGPTTSVGGYPQSAAICALLEITCYSAIPNFIGDEADFNKLVSAISAGAGPDYFVTSIDNFPDSLDSKYFPNPQPLLLALQSGYLQDQVFSFGPRQLVVFRRKEVLPVDGAA